MARFARLMGEISVAAPETIAHRSAMMLTGMQDPSAVDHPEMQLMMAEKVNAGVEAATAMLQGDHGLPAMLSDHFERQANSAGALLSDLSNARSPFDFWTAQMRFSQASVGNAVATGLAVAGVLGAVALAGTRPVHRVATANVRRLRRGAAKRGG